VKANSRKTVDAFYAKLKAKKQCEIAVAEAK
jgi:hypothetical protein